MVFLCRAMPLRCILPKYDSVSTLSFNGTICVCHSKAILDKPPFRSTIILLFENKLVKVNGKFSGEATL